MEYQQRLSHFFKTFYDHFECCITMGNILFEWFLKQSYIPPIIFLVIIDWITTITTVDRPLDPILLA